jgi:hypothetical protein
MVPRMTDMLCPLGAGGRGWLSSYNKENNAVDNVFHQCHIIVDPNRTARYVISIAKNHTVKNTKFA